MREAMQLAAENALSYEDAARRMGVTRAEIAERVAAGELLELDDGRLLPAWQFARGRTLPGLPQLIEAWPGTPLALALWAERPNVDLHGRTPAQELARPGGVPRVLEAVVALSPAAW